jgi:heme O synthase-like polyprenyltransferase
MLWALLGIVIIVTVYELSPRTGLALAGLAALAMIYTFYSKRTISWETVLPPSGQ